MYLYEKLIRNALEQDNGPTYRELARQIGTQTTTLYDWLDADKKPHLKNLIVLAAWAKLPLFTMLIETDLTTPDEQIALNLSKLTNTQKQQILEQIQQLTSDT